jgi:hypothetical protein
MWPDVLCDQMYYVTRCIMWPDVLCDQMYYVARCIMWPDVLCGQMYYVPLVTNAEIHKYVRLMFKMWRKYTR